MKYGEFLDRHHVPGWRAQYLRYTHLADQIEEGDLPEEAYIQAVTEEQDRVDRFVAGKIVEIVGNLQHLELQTDDTVAEETAATLRALDTYVRQNLEGFRKLMKKYTKKTGFSKAWCVCDCEGKGV